MRILLLALVAALLALYFTVGVRLGYVTLTDTYMFNATGTSTYNFRTLDDRQQVGVVGQCKVRSGRATIRLYSPDHTQIGGQVCQKGDWSLNVMGGGKAGIYEVEVVYEKFNGSISMKETRSGESQ